MDSTQWHRLTEKNILTSRGICSKCGPVDIFISTQPRRGSRYAEWICGNKKQEELIINREKSKERQQQKRIKRQEFKGTKCTRCGIEVENICQMDIHHIDGNHFNNKDENRQPLCANCHRLITYYETCGKEIEFCVWIPQ